MSRRRHTPEWMQERVEEYLSDKASIKTIARVNEIGVNTLKGWVHKYREQGISCFLEREGNSNYGKIFKKKCRLTLHRRHVFSFPAQHNLLSKKKPPYQCLSSEIRSMLFQHMGGYGLSGVWG